MTGAAAQCLIMTVNLGVEVGIIHTQTSMQRLSTGGLGALQLSMTESYCNVSVWMDPFKMSKMRLFAREDFNSASSASLSCICSLGMCMLTPSSFVISLSSLAVKAACDTPGYHHLTADQMLKITPMRNFFCTHQDLRYDAQQQIVCNLSHGA